MLVRPDAIELAKGKPAPVGRHFDHSEGGLNKLKPVGIPRLHIKAHWAGIGTEETTLGLRSTCFLNKSENSIPKTKVTHCHIPALTLLVGAFIAGLDFDFPLDIEGVRL